MNKLAKFLILAILAVKASAAIDGPPPNLAKMEIETECPGADTRKLPTDITVEQFDAAFSNVGEGGGRKRWARISDDQWMLEVESVDKVLNMRTSYRFVFVFDPSRSGRALFARMAIDSVEANKTDRYIFVQNDIKAMLAKLNKSKPPGPALIDNKNEHLGLRLGSFRRDLRYRVIKEETEECRRFRYSDRNDLQQLEARQTKVEIALPPGFVFGNFQFVKMRLFYVANRLCEINMVLPDDADIAISISQQRTGMSYEQQQEAYRLQQQQYKRAGKTLIEALTAKYGAPADADRDGAGEFAAWEGADVYLGFHGIGLDLNYSRFGPNPGGGVTFGSKKALEAATQDLLKEAQSQQDDSKKKAQELKDKI